jgi:hypothetical protein
MFTKLRSHLTYGPTGKRAIGSGADIVGGSAGSNPEVLTDVVIDSIVPSSATTVPGSVEVVAQEEEPTTASWTVRAIALCANVS